MTPETRTALHHAQHAQQWAPVGLHAAQMTAGYDATPRPMVAPPPPYSGKRLVVDSTGRAAPQPMSEDDIRIPTYQRRGRPQHEGA